MDGRLRRVVGDLTGRSQQRALDTLLAQIDATLAATALAADMVAAKRTPASARRAMVVVEHSGDAHRAALVAELAASLTTPIDREDLYRLSRSVDDVLDNLRDLVRETDMYGSEPVVEDLAALTAVTEGLELLRVAVQNVPGHAADVVTATLGARKRAGRVRQLYQGSLAALFRGELTVELLKRRELLRRIDVVGLRLGECADALSDAMQKRGR